MDKSDYKFYRAEIRRRANTEHIVRNAMLQGAAIMAVEILAYWGAYLLNWINYFWGDIRVYLLMAVPSLLLIIIWNYISARNRLWRTAHELHLENERIIDKKTDHIRALEEEFIGEFEDGDMSGNEVLNYALKYSGLMIRSEIEKELRIAAGRENDPIRVCAHPYGDSVLCVFKRELFKSYTIQLENNDIEGFIYSIYDPEKEPVGIGPCFFREEIERLWPPKPD